MIHLRFFFGLFGFQVMSELIAGGPSELQSHNDEGGSVSMEVSDVKQKDDEGSASKAGSNEGWDATS